MEYLKDVTDSANMSGLYQERQTPSLFVVASMTFVCAIRTTFFLPIVFSQPSPVRYTNKLQLTNALA